MLVLGLKHGATQLGGEVNALNSKACIACQLMGVKSVARQARLLGKVSFAGATKCLILPSKARQGSTVIGEGTKPAHSLCS